MKNNNLSELDNISIYHSWKEVKNFFRPYVGEIQEKCSNDELTIYKAASPNGPGKIHISGVGGWYDEPTGEMGSMKSFLKRKYPLITDLGAATAVQREYLDLLRIDFEVPNESFDQDELNNVRELARENKRAENEYVHDFRIDTISILDNGDVHYYDCHEVQKTGDPNGCLTKETRYSFDSSFAPIFTRFIHGVQKIEEHPGAERIYFVENPLQLVILSEVVDDPIYIRPNQESYFYNDYNRLVDGKKVVLAKKVMPGSNELENLELKKFKSKENVDFFTFYGESMPHRKDLLNTEPFLASKGLTIIQSYLMANSLMSRGIKVVNPYSD